MYPQQSKYHANQNINPDAFQKLLRIELKQARKKTLLNGVLMGAILCILIEITLGFFLWFNKDKVTEVALEYIVSTYMKELFQAFPDGYVSHNQHKILPVLDDFTNAAAAKKVSEGEFKEIGKSIILALSDKELTYHEIDAILLKMKQASKNGSDFN